MIATEALAFSDRAEAKRVADELWRRKFHAEVVDPGWGTGEWVVVVRLDARIAALLGGLT